MDFISENDLKGSQSDVARIGACMPPLGKFLGNFAPGLSELERIAACRDLQQMLDDEVQSGAQHAENILECANLSLPGQEYLDMLDDAMDAAEACQLGPDGFAANETTFFFSCDPNDKVGPFGIGSERYTTGEAPIPYTIFFENKAEASVPAQEVVITDQLDSVNLDLSTFRLGPIAFGDKLVLVPAGRTEYNTDVDLRPETNLIARINARLDQSTGLVTWRYYSLDPATLQPTLDPLAGFLPPNVIPGKGEGSVTFTVEAKTDVVSGTQVSNSASIVFDTNAPILTPIWFNTVDKTKPISSVQPLPATTNTANFLVNWGGTDQHSGIVNFSVYVSENGGPFTLWRLNTSETSRVFNGQNGINYRFFSTARDLTGNAEDIKTIAEATTTVVLTPTAASVSISGRVITSNGRGIANARISLINPKGETDQTLTNSFGYYRFGDVRAGESYILSVRSKRFQFAQPTRVIVVMDNLTDENFTALP